MDIEILHIGDKLLVCNEEGKLQNLSYNAIATRIINAVGIKDYIVGNVLFCDKDKSNNYEQRTIEKIPH